jgi:hypothetical protein
MEFNSGHTNTDNNYDCKENRLTPKAHPTPNYQKDD